MNPSYQVHQTDCLPFLKTLSSDSVDAVITDPPYSSGGLHAGDRAGSVNKKYVQTGTQVFRPDFGNDNKDQRSWAFWCHLWLSECYRVAKPGSPICVFSDWRQLPLLTDVLQSSGWIWRGIAVWDKTGGARPYVGRFTNQCEYIAWGSKGPMAKDRGVGVLPGVFTFPVKQSDKFHVTGKPTGLMRDLVRIVAPGGTVLDPFEGSGTTGVPCAEAGLNFIGVEQDDHYYGVSQERLAEAYACVVREVPA